MSEINACVTLYVLEINARAQIAPVYLVANLSYSSGHLKVDCDLLVPKGC